MTPSLERPFLPLESVTSGLERPSLPLEGATKPVESATPGLEGPLPPLESATLPLRGAAKPLGIATEPLEETLTPAAKKMILLSTILDWAEGGDFCDFALEDLPSGVGGTIVHHNDFVWNAA